MKHTVNIEEEFTIPEKNLGDVDAISTRVNQAINDHKNVLQAILKYLYLPTASPNVIKHTLRASVAKIYLTSAEQRVFNWLKTRTNGSERKNYGPNCIYCVRESKYRCSICLDPDVRVLQIDHKLGRKDDNGITRLHFKRDEFQCLCANCHRIKTVTEKQEN